MTFALQTIKDSNTIILTILLVNLQAVNKIQLASVMKANLNFLHLLSNINKQEMLGFCVMVGRKYY